MEREFKKASGISLLIGSLLLVATMVLHPSGGSIEHILNIKKVIIISHSLAILSLPFIGFGFWGLSLSLTTKSRVSMLAFMVAALGLVAAMIAAAVNGITLPLFVSEVANQDYDVNTIKLITTYGRSLNISMDYIIILSFGLAIMIWSALMVKGVNFPKWMGYYGLVLMVAGLVALLNQFNFVGLFGFRVFIFGIVTWIIAVGIKILLPEREKI